MTKGPRTKAGRALMAVNLRHSAYCYVKNGGQALLSHPERCICGLLTDVLAIEAEGFSEQSLNRNAMPVRVTIADGSVGMKRGVW